MARDITDPVLSDAVHNLLTLHGYSATWIEDACAWVAYKDTDKSHTFVMGVSNTLGQWREALTWFEAKQAAVNGVLDAAGIIDKMKRGAASYSTSQYPGIKHGK